jgi:perosamine synthetase
LIRIAQINFDHRESEALRCVIESGHWRMGAVTERFERRFALAAGARHAVAVSSGTAALFLAYKALLKPGNEIIVPDFTFAATASMAMAVGAKPVFADVTPQSLTLDPKDVECRITRRTRALAPVHLYGMPAEIPALTRLARHHRLKMIWDAAQAHGARFGVRDVGAFPDVVCYSFYPSKNMTTGEGGMLTTSDFALAKELRLLRSHGESSRYFHERVGFNFRPTDIASALGIVQLGKLRAAVAARRRNARILARGLREISGIEVPQECPGRASAFNCFTIRISPETLGLSRDEFQHALARRGIETAVHYPRPLHRQPIFRGFGRDRDFPVSARLAQTVISLPVHPKLSRADLEKIIAAVRETALAKGRF